MTLFSPEQTSVAALLLFRVTALVWVAPMFSARAVSRQLKIAILAILTILLYPSALATASAGAAVTPTAILGELTVGLILGG